VSTATESGSGTVPGEISARVSRRLYLPTVVMAAITAWLSWRGWTALEDFGPARSIRAGRFQLIGPVVIGFVLVVFSIEQLWPAERRPLLARGHLLDLGYLVFYAVLVVPLVVLIGAGFADLLADAARGWCCPACRPCPAGASSRSPCSASTPWTGWPIRQSQDHGPVAAACGASLARRPLVRREILAR
jgi:hypothetical protein